MFAPIYIFLFLGVVLLQASGPTVRAQVISLRHPESSSQYAPRAPVDSQGAQGPPQRSRFTARPGNVIVHFNRNHDIQRLQYVLQDGQLATLYQSPNQHPAIGRAPVQVPLQPKAQPESQPQQPPNQVYRRDEPSTSNPGKSAQPDQPHINHDQTIDILDAKMRGVSQLIGDHITIELPSQPGTSGANEASKGAGGDRAKAGPSEDKNLDILATVAADAIQSGATMGEAKLKKFSGILLDKLKVKMSQKLHDLPGLIDSKLRSKSSVVGEGFLDKADKHIMFVNDDEPTASQASKQPSSAASQPVAQAEPSGSETPAPSEKNADQQRRHQLSQPAFIQQGGNPQAQPANREPALSPHILMD